MTSVRQLFPPAAVLEHVCRGLPVVRTGPILDAAAELGELHAARYRDEGCCGFDRYRLRLICRIDVWAASVIPVPREDARMHCMSLGVLLDRVAECCATAFRASPEWVDEREAADAQAELRQILDEYTDLVGEIAAGECCLRVCAREEVMTMGAVAEPQLKFSYAKARIAEIERIRYVYLAAEAGMPQRDIARVVHLSQAGVHRMIARARVAGVAGSVEEIVLQRHIGQIDTVEMMRRLASFEQWVPRMVDPVDGVLPGGSEEELESLLDDGFLTEEELDQIVAAHE